MDGRFSAGRAARERAGGDGRPSPSPRSRRRSGDKALLSPEAIVDAGLVVLREDGLDAVTMRRVATALRTGPASLYVYFADRDALLESMLDRVLAEVPLESADAKRWRAQVHALMDETVAALLRHPGIARVGLAHVPIAGSALRIREAMFGALVAGGVDAEAASGAIDTLPLLALATAVEAGVQWSFWLAIITGAKPVRRRPVQVGDLDVDCPPRRANAPPCDAQRRALPAIERLRPSSGPRYVACVTSVATCAWGA